MSEDRRRPGPRQKRDYPSPVRENFGQGPYFPSGGRGSHPWPAKRGRVDGRMPWGRGGRGPPIDLRSDRFPASRRSPAHSFDDVSRGSHRSWSGSTGHRGGSAMTLDSPRDYNAQGGGRGIDRRGHQAPPRSWEWQRDGRERVPRDVREVLPARDADQYRANPGEDPADPGWRGHRLPPPPARRLKEPDLPSYDSRDRPPYVGRLARDSGERSFKDSGHAFQPPSGSRWDSGAPPSPRRYSRRSPTRTSKSPRRRHSYKERSGKDSKSSKGSQKERSRSRSRRGLNKERGSQKPLTRVKTEPAAQPALEAEKGMGLEIAAVELQMSPVTPRESEDVPDQAFNSPKVGTIPGPMDTLPTEKPASEPPHSDPPPESGGEAKQQPLLPVDSLPEDSKGTPPQADARIEAAASGHDVASDDPPKRKRLGWGQGLARLQSKDTKPSGDSMEVHSPDGELVAPETEHIKKEAEAMSPSASDAEGLQASDLGMKSPFEEPATQDQPLQPPVSAPLPLALPLIFSPDDRQPIPGAGLQKLRLTPKHPQEGALDLASPVVASAFGQPLWMPAETPMSPVSPTLPTLATERSASIATPGGSKGELHSPMSLSHSPASATMPARTAQQEAELEHRQSAPDTQLSKVAILLAIETMDGTIENLNSKLAALTTHIRDSKARLDELEAEQQRLQDPVPEPEAVESSCDEQISSMSESSAGSSDRNRHPMSVASTHSSMDEEEESGHQLNGHLDDTMYHFRESDAASLSGDSADSSITTASVAVEPLMGYMELVEEGKRLLVENNKTAWQSHQDAGLMQEAATRYRADKRGYMQPSDFPQYHQSIKDHSASREKLLAAVAHHKQHVWEKELAVTLEYRELQERWRTYFYNTFGEPRGPASNDGQGTTMLRAASKKLATARSELEERRVSLQKTAIDRLNRLALCLTWPDQKLDDRSRKYSIFPSDNARIEDPVRLLKHEADMRPWSDEEKKIFLDKYLSHVKFFYKIQKSDDFATVRRKQQLKKRRAQSETNKQFTYNYMGMGATPMTARGKPVFPTERAAPTAMTASVPPDDMLSMAPIARSGKGRPKGPLRGKGGSALASTIALNLPGSEPVMEEVKQAWGDQQPENFNGWTAQEEALLARGLVIFGRDFKSIAKNMGLNRTTAACKSFFSKNRVRCQLDEALRQHEHFAASMEGGELQHDEAMEGDAEPASPNLQGNQARMAFGSSADMDCPPSSPRSLPMLPASGVGTPLMPENGLLPENSPIPNAQGIVAQEAPASEVASMLPHESVQPDGMQSLFEAPYGLPGMGSAGFQSQSYALSQLGNLFQPAQSLPVSGPGLGVPPSAQLGTIMQLQLMNNPQLIQSPQMQQIAASMMNFAPPNFMGMPAHLYSLLLAMGNSSQGLPFPPQMLATFPGMQGPGMGFGPLANQNPLQSLLSPEVIQQLQQQMEGGEHAEDQQTGSGHMLAEEPAAAEQLREEPALEDSGSGAIEGLTRRSASMWTSDEKGSFLSCFKVHGRDWKQLGLAVPNKTETQIKNYFQNYKSKLGLDRMELPPSAIHPGQRRRKSESRQQSAPPMAAAAAPSIPPALDTGGLSIPSSAADLANAAKRPGSASEGRRRHAESSGGAQTAAMEAGILAGATAGLDALEDAAPTEAVMSVRSQSYTIPAAQWRDQASHQAGEAVSEVGGEEQPAAASITEIPDLLGANPNVQNLLQILRSEMFQGDKGGAGTAAFIHTKPENSLSEFISRNPQLFHQVQAAASSMQDNEEAGPDRRLAQSEVPQSTSGPSQVALAAKPALDQATLAMTDNNPGQVNASSELSAAEKLLSVPHSNGSAMPEALQRPVVVELEPEPGVEIKSHKAKAAVDAHASGLNEKRAFHSEAGHTNRRIQASESAGKRPSHTFGTADALATLGSSQMGLAAIGVPTVEKAQLKPPGEWKAHPQTQGDSTASGNAPSPAAFLRPWLQEALMHTHSYPRNQNSASSLPPSTKRGVNKPGDELSPPEGSSPWASQSPEHMEPENKGLRAKPLAASTNLISTLQPASTEIPQEQRQVGPPPGTAQDPSPDSASIEAAAALPPQIDTAAVLLQAQLQGGAHPSTAQLGQSLLAAMLQQSVQTPKTAEDFQPTQAKASSSQ